jgi:hypothetical protein
MNETLKIGLTTLLIVVALIIASFFLGRYSKQYPTPDPIIRYVQTNNQIKQIQNEIDSLDLIINSDVVTMPRSVRDSLRSLLNPR